MSSLVEVSRASIKTAEAATLSEADRTVASAKQRIAAIIALPQAKGREDLAWKFALETDISVDVARGLLEAAPIAQKDSSFNAAMRAAGNPNLGSGANSAPAEQHGSTSWSDAISTVNKQFRVKGR